MQECLISKTWLIISSKDNETYIVWARLFSQYNLTIGKGAHLLFSADEKIAI